MPEQMTPEELEAYIGNMIEEAVDYNDQEESPERATAERYWRGERFNASAHTPKEKPGRSEFVSMEVRDSVSQMLAPIMRTLFSSENVVEFEPRKYEDIATAKQATEYCNFLLKERNNGYQLLDSVVKDCLIKGIGVMQCWWEDKSETELRELSGIDPETAAAIMQQGQWEVVESEQGEDGLFEMSLRRTTTDGQIQIDAVPPEEFLISRNAVSVDDARLVGRRQRLTVSDLVELGYDYDLVMQYADTDTDYKSNPEWLLRHPTWQEEEDETNGPNKALLYCEVFVKVDADGDGVAEHRKFCTIGSAYNVVKNVVVQDHGFSVCRMEPIPHHFTGISVYNLVGDIQRMKSAVMRQCLDSLALSTTPRLAVVEGQVDSDDLDGGDEIGKLIHVRQQGAIQQLTVEYTGAQAMPMLDYLDQMSQKRTGLTDASQGLDAASLQSSTAVAVESQIKAAGSRLELYTRNIIETGIKPLFAKMLALISYHQDQQDLILLRGQYTPIDPSGWPVMAVRVSMPIGGANVQEKSQLLQLIMQKQESLLQLMGPDNGFAGIQQYHTTLMRMLELNGIPEARDLFGDPQQVLQQLQQSAQQSEEQPASPEAAVAQATVEAKMLDVQHRARKDALDDDRARDKLAIELYLKAAELKAKYPGIELDMTPLTDELQRNRQLDKIEEETQAERYRQALAAVGQSQTPEGMAPNYADFAEPTLQ